MRSVQTAATQYSPYELLFGRGSMRLPADSALDFRPSLCDVDSDDYVIQLKRSLTQAWAVARENIVHSQRKAQKAYNRTAKGHELYVGDMVVAKRTPGQTTVGSKLLPKQLGPFEVCELNETDAKLRDTITNQCSRWVNRSKLTKVPFPAQPEPPTPQPEPQQPELPPSPLAAPTPHRIHSISAHATLKSMETPSPSQGKPTTSVFGPRNGAGPHFATDHAPSNLPQRSGGRTLAPICWNDSVKPGCRPTTAAHWPAMGSHPAPAPATLPPAATPAPLLAPIERTLPASWTKH
ncbi:MAG: hypothetical protein GY820_40865 [Gammaproteobacteria bacterium]|nr:hypothetical protein [Gammaproteobacteria bacterium]